MSDSETEIKRIRQISVTAVGELALPEYIRRTECFFGALNDVRRPFCFGALPRLGIMGQEGPRS
jgi:hypothetical protein